MQVLNTYVEYNYTVLFALASLIASILLLLYLLKDDITRFLENHFNGFIYENAAYAWLAMFLSALVIITSAYFIVRKPHVYAEATIIDEYPIGALYSKYEVKERRGDLWILEIRDSYVEEVTAGDSRENR